MRSLVATAMALGFTALSACQQSGTPQPLSAADSAAIDSVRMAYQTAYNAGDAAAVSSLFAEDAVVLSQDTTPVRGRAAITELLTAQLSATPRPAVEISPGATIGRQDMAVAMGSYRVSVPSATGDTATAMSYDGKYLVLLMKQLDGSWKIMWDAGSRNAPLPPPAPAPRRRG